MWDISYKEKSFLYLLSTLKSDSGQERCSGSFGLAKMDSLAALSVDERKLVVGIDFGTTFSGLAWAETRRVSDRLIAREPRLKVNDCQSDYQSVVESWPASIGTHEGMSSVKVPTEIRYTTGGIEWGFQIPATMGRHKWFKL